MLGCGGQRPGVRGGRGVPGENGRNKWRRAPDGAPLRGPRAEARRGGPPPADTVAGSEPLPGNPGGKPPRIKAGPLNLIPFMGAGARRGKTAREGAARLAISDLTGRRFGGGPSRGVGPDSTRSASPVAGLDQRGAQRPAAQAGLAAQG